MKNALRALAPALALAAVVGCGKAPTEPPRAVAPPVPAPAAPPPAAPSTAATAPAPPVHVTVEESQPQDRPAAPKSVAARPRTPKARVTQPVQVRRVSPQYPDVAKRMRLEGVVTLKARVKSDGSVDQVKVVNGVHPLLDGAAERAVQQWRYDPATVDGRPVPAGVRVTVGFKL